MNNPILVECLREEKRGEGVEEVEERLYDPLAVQRVSPCNELEGWGSYVEFWDGVFWIVRPEPEQVIFKQGAPNE